MPSDQDATTSSWHTDPRCARFNETKRISQSAKEKREALSPKSVSAQGHLSPGGAREEHSNAGSRRIGFCWRLAARASSARSVAKAVSRSPYLSLLAVFSWLRPPGCGPLTGCLSGRSFPRGRRTHRCPGRRRIRTRRPMAWPRSSDPRS